MSNIFINNKSKIKFNISKSEYWDLTLAKESENYDSYNLSGNSLYDDNLISYINIDDENCIVNNNTLQSLDTYKWVDAINEGVNLNNVGYNWIDNGLVNFDIDTINFSDFKNILTGTTLNIEKGDYTLKLYPVTGNTKQYDYETYITGDTNNINKLTLNGGWYQGVYKINNNYQILPNDFDEELTFEFTLTPLFDNEIDTKTLNYLYPENKGTFFFMGLRSENKFSYEYKNNLTSFIVDKTGVTSPNIDNETLVIDNKFPTSLNEYYNIETNNKFLTFNRKEDGNTASEYNYEIVTITGTTSDEINYYQYFDRTVTGYTIENNLEDIKNINTNEYNIINDIYNNAISFIIKDNGSVGYRYIDKNCETDLGFEILEEYSDEGVVKNNIKQLISIRIIPLTNKMKILFYVNSKLVFISQELTMLDFRILNDSCEKQETIPFNISLGGGTQGLCDMVGLNDKYSTQYLLPLEHYFAGSLIGDLYKFRINYGKMDYSKIRNNYLYEFTDMETTEILTTTICYYGNYITENVNNNDILSLNNINLENIESFSMTTGTENNIFIIALPNNMSLKSVNDTNSLNAVLTNLFIESSITLTIFQKNIDYKVYIMKNAIPYSISHVFNVKINK